MKKTIIYFLTTFIIIILLGFSLILINKNIPASGYLKFSAQLGKDTAMISSLNPVANVSLVDDYQNILDNQVYFDLRSLNWFNGGWIELVYQPIGRQLVGLSIQRGDSLLDEVKKPLSDINLSDGWRQAFFYFDFSVPLNKKNIRRFTIESVGQPGDVLKIKSINIILER